MRKEYGKSLRMLFDQRIQESLPEFSPVKVSSMYFTPGDRAYEKKHENGESYWICLNINQKLECFTVEIGWSVLGRWPELGMRPSSIRPGNKTEFAEGEYLTRLPFLWTSEDYWFEIEPFNPDSDLADLMKQMEPIDSKTAQEKVVPVVEECVARIIKYAIPYFEEHAKRIA